MSYYHRPAPTQVGILTIHEPVTVDVSYETAAWHSAIELKPGEYPVFVSGNYDRRGLYADVPGVFVDHYTPSLYGGVRVGTYTGEDMIGTPTKHRVGGGWYVYTDAHANVFARVGSFRPLEGADTGVGVSERRITVPAHDYLPGRQVAA